MKIAISSLEEDEKSQMDPRFGRSQYFYIFDTKTNIGYFISNRGRDSAQGAGVSTAQNIILEKIDIAISGQFGPKAQSILKDSGIKLYQAKSELTLKEIMEAFQKNTLEEV